MPHVPSIPAPPRASGPWRPLSVVVGVVLVTALIFVALPLALAAVAVFVVVALAGGAWVVARAMVARATRPNGVLDGRRNVRVIRPDDAPPSVQGSGAAPGPLSHPR